MAGELSAAPIIPAVSLELRGDGGPPTQPAIAPQDKAVLEMIWNATNDESHPASPERPSGAPGGGPTLPDRHPQSPAALDAAGRMGESPDRDIPGSLPAEGEGPPDGDVTAPHIHPEPRRQATAVTAIRVLLVDDHSILRRGLASLLKEEPDIEVVGEADNGREAVDFVEMLHPDVVVMDIAMPIMNGVEATRIIKSTWPEIRVVGLSMYRKDELGRQMLSAGADAFVTKSSSSEILVRAIRGG